MFITVYVNGEFFRGWHVVVIKSSDGDVSLVVSDSDVSKKVSQQTDKFWVSGSIHVGCF